MIRPIHPITRSGWDATWAKRLKLTALPVCPVCNKLIPPDLWDGHQATHETPPDPIPTEAEIARHAAQEGQ